MTFLWSQTDLGLNSSSTTYEHWNLGESHLICLDLSFLASKMGIKLWFLMRIKFGLGVLALTSFQYTAAIIPYVWWLVEYKEENLI